jgi:glycosyltransferase involved in cell wall biosynthesis
VETEFDEVVVLLATYNGANYLDDQLASLQNQEGVRVFVIANDDGSTDKTLDILNSWKKSGLIHTITRSNQIGSTSAFLQLLSRCSNYKYVAFCDQDDVWYPNKLIKLVELTEENHISMSICGREIISENAELLSIKRSLKAEPSFVNALVENIAPGNCTLLNNAAIKLINSYKSPPIRHFDSWIYLNVSGLGKCHLTSEKLVQYRIHSANSVGLRRYRVLESIDSIYDYARQAEYFELSNRGKLPANIDINLRKYLDIFKRKSKLKTIILIARCPIARQRKMERFLYKTLLFYSVVLMSRYI